METCERIEEGLSNKCSISIAKAIMDKVRDDDLLCDIIVDIATMLDKEDKRWIVNTIGQFISKGETNGSI